MRPECVLVTTRSASGGLATVVGSEVLLFEETGSVTELLVTLAVVVRGELAAAPTFTFKVMFGALVPVAMALARVHVTVGPEFEQLHPVPVARL
jgi:hypothetical protein